MPSASAPAPASAPSSSASPSKASSARFGTLLPAFASYCAHRASNASQLTHAALAMCIVGSLAALLTGVRVPLAPWLARALPALPPLPVSVSCAALSAPLLALFYAQLAARAGLPLVGLGAGACVMALWRGVEAFVAARGGLELSWRPALALLALSCAAQLLGRSAGSTAAHPLEEAGFVHDEQPSSPYLLGQVREVRLGDRYHQRRENRRNQPV